MSLSTEFKRVLGNPTISQDDIKEQFKSSVPLIKVLKQAVDKELSTVTTDLMSEEYDTLEAAALAHARAKAKVDVLFQLQSILVD